MTDSFTKWRKLETISILLPFVIIPHFLYHSLFHLVYNKQSHQFMISRNISADVLGRCEINFCDSHCDFENIEEIIVIKIVAIIKLGFIPAILLLTNTK